MVFYACEGLFTEKVAAKGSTTLFIPVRIGFLACGTPLGERMEIRIVWGILRDRNIGAGGKTELSECCVCVVNEHEAYFNIEELTFRGTGIVQKLVTLIIMISYLLLPEENDETSVQAY